MIKKLVKFCHCNNSKSRINTILEESKIPGCKDINSSLFICILASGEDIFSIFIIKNCFFKIFGENTSPSTLSICQLWQALYHCGTGQAQSSNLRFIEPQVHIYRNYFFTKFPVFESNVQNLKLAAILTRYSGD